MAPDSNPMKAAIPNARMAPSPLVAQLAGAKGSTLTPSGEAAKEMMLTTMTMMNSKATTNPTTLADRSIFLIPIHATITNPISAPAHQGIAHPVLRSEEHTSELQSRGQLVCSLLL